MSKFRETIQGHHARNRELLRLIASKGVDLSVKRAIDLHFWAYSEEGARKFANALGERWLAPAKSGTRIDDTPIWSVEVQIHISPILVTSPAFVEKHVRFACEYDCEYDGWGTSL